jgi:hypothetical protein
VLGCRAGIHLNLRCIRDPLAFIGGTRSCDSPVATEDIEGLKQTSSECRAAGRIGVPAGRLLFQDEICPHAAAGEVLHTCTIFRAIGVGVEVPEGLSSGEALEIFPARLTSALA